MAINNLYCKIFLDTDLDYIEVYESLKNFVRGQKQAVSFIISDWCSTDVQKNKEYIPNSNDFLYWKYIINVEPENVSAEFYIDNIKKLINFLNEKYFGAVIACDFEDILKKEK